MNTDHPPATEPPGAEPPGGGDPVSSAGTAPASAGAPPWRRYVAIGDSFTEGMADPDPVEPSGYRGWADLTAAELSSRRVRAGLPALEYANLAVRGRLLAEVLDQQLPEALRARPDLVSIVGGGNDLLRPGVDVTALARRLDRAVATARAAGATVLMATAFDVSGAPVLRMIRHRVSAYNAHIWSIAHRHGAHVLDVWGMRSLADWRMWAPDRIHLSTSGHERAAQGALVALGLAPATPDWDEPLRPLPPQARAERLRSNATWLREHAGPWVGRRLRRRSSGSGVVAKRPEPLPLLSPPEEES